MQNLLLRMLSSEGPPQCLLPPKGAEKIYCVIGKVRHQGKKLPSVKPLDQHSQMVITSLLSILYFPFSPSLLLLFPFLLSLPPSPPLLSLPVCPLISPFLLFLLFSLLVQEARKSGLNWYLNSLTGIAHSQGHFPALGHRLLETMRVVIAR